VADTKVSALTAVATPAGTDEFPVNQGAVSKKMTLAQIDTYVTTAPVFAAGSASANTHPEFTSGTLLTSVEAGATEYVAPLLHFTGDASNQGRGLIPVEHLVCVNSDVTGTAGTGSQPIFAAATDRITLAGSTAYLFELYLQCTNGATTCTKALDFSGGTATFTFMNYAAIGQGTLAVNTTGTAQSAANVNQATSTVILATGTTQWWLRARGAFRINAGGTFLPQFAFSANPTGTVLIKAGTFIRITPIGGTGTIAIGSWA
jgi:hypothetical protein